LSSPSFTRKRCDESRDAGKRKYYVSHDKAFKIQSKSKQQEEEVKKLVAAGDVGDRLHVDRKRHEKEDPFRLPERIIDHIGHLGEGPVGRITVEVGASETF
jgi:hypothetical protein